MNGKRSDATFAAQAATVAGIPNTVLSA